MLTLSLPSIGSRTGSGGGARRLRLLQRRLNASLMSRCSALSERAVPLGLKVEPRFEIGGLVTSSSGYFSTASCRPSMGPNDLRTETPLLVSFCIFYVLTTDRSISVGYMFKFDLFTIQICPANIKICLEDIGKIWHNDYEDTIECILEKTFFYSLYNFYLYKAIDKTEVHNISFVII